MNLLDMVDEAIFCISFCTFYDNPTQEYLMIGGAFNANPNPRSCSNGFIRAYLMKNYGQELELVHTVRVWLI